MKSFFKRKTTVDDGTAGSSRTGVDQLLAEAELHLQDGNIDRAIKSYHTALEYHPGNVSLLIARSFAYMCLPQPQLILALKDANAAVEDSPGSWRAWYQKGRALAADGQHDESLQSLTTCLELAPLADRFGPEQLLGQVRNAQDDGSGEVNPSGFGSSDVSRMHSRVTDMAPSTDMADPPPEYTPSSKAPVPVSAPVATSTPVYISAPVAHSSGKVDEKADKVSQYTLLKIFGAIYLERTVTSNKATSFELRHVGIMPSKSAEKETSSLYYKARLAHSSLAAYHLDENPKGLAQKLKPYPGYAPTTLGSLIGTYTVNGLGRLYAADFCKPSSYVSAKSKRFAVTELASPNLAFTRLVCLYENKYKEDSEGLRKSLGMTNKKWMKIVAQGRWAQARAIVTAMESTEPPRSLDPGELMIKNTRIYGGYLDRDDIQYRKLLKHLLLGIELSIRFENGVLNASDITSRMLEDSIIFAKRWQSSCGMQSSCGIENLKPLRFKEQKEALLRFAERISWPYLEETRRYMGKVSEEALKNSVKVRQAVQRWLFGAILPGNEFRRALMTALVATVDSLVCTLRGIVSDHGLLLPFTSYWFADSAIGKVLGGLEQAHVACGWIGPVAPPVVGASKDPGFVHTHITNHDSKFTLPPQKKKDSQETQLLESVRDGETCPKDKIRLWNAKDGETSAVLQRIRLEPVISSGIKSYLANLDFMFLDADGNRTEEVTFRIDYCPIFVEMPRCIQGPHSIDPLEAGKIESRIVRAKDLKIADSCRDELMIIEAEGRGEDAVARAWCAENGRNAVLRDMGRDCFHCAVRLAGAEFGLGFNVLISLWKVSY